MLGFRQATVANLSSLVEGPTETKAEVWGQFGEQLI